MTCSTNIKFDIEGNVVKNIVFTGGCAGNLKAIPILVDGMGLRKRLHFCSCNN
ncbi:MAG: TSCPD domain-containing protein [Lachnospiraceae bacterium]|nr:TSCPD domain-containing protein [Lachnospiraceae bacterium]